ncbi:MAG: AEC family transporter [Nannocystales bacterium]
MIVGLDTTLRLLQLAVPAVLGGACGALRLFPDPRAAVVVLNRYALYIGFPALVTRGLLLPSAVIPHQPAFWLLWPVALTLLLFGVPRARDSALGLGMTFGNVAYLGLPYVLAVMGEGMAGPAALAVAVHVSGAVTVGPALLARASGAGGGVREVVRRVARQPLFWAPAVGLAMRSGSADLRTVAADVLQPFAASAAVIALFLLGLHVFIERARVGSIGVAVLALVGARMLAAPALVLVLAWAAVAMGWLPPELARVHVLLAAMPLAITTFSMAHDARVEADRVAGAVVVSSLLAAVMLPLWAMAAALLA